MPTNILITGASGYRGSAIVYALTETALPADCTLHASVRNPAAAEAVTSAGLVPWTSDLHDPVAVARDVLENEISVVFWLVDVLRVDAQRGFLKALAEVKRKTGKKVHFLQTSGAKIFSDLAGAPTDRPLLDTTPDLYETQKSQKAPFSFMQNASLIRHRAIETNNVVVEQGEALGVRTYIFAPCIVYGEHQGFGNPISIQNVAIVNAAKAAGQVYKVDQNRPTWPVCHVSDNARLYTTILAHILAGDEALGHGRHGYYLASSGSVAWEDMYASIAAALVRQGVIASAEVALADDAALERMAQGLGGIPKELVRVQLGGKCTFTAEHGTRIGWHPQYAPDHILETADAEVERILRHSDK